MRPACFTPLVCLAAFAARPALAQSWEQHGVVASGIQFDAVSDGTERLFLLSNEFVELDDEGNVLNRDSAVGDDAQAALSFPPAIAYGADGAIHVVTRHNGDYATGYQLRYRRRNASGNWDLDMTVGEKTARNYVVGLAALDDGRVFFAHSREATNGALVSFYELTEGDEQAMGGFTDETWLRSDADFRMRGSADRVVLATGSPWPDGHVHFFAATPDSGLVDGLIASHRLHNAGSGRRGMPDLSVTAAGGVALVYGAYHQVFHTEYDQNGNQEGVDSPIFDGLGDWAFALGLSAIGVTRDREYQLAVGLRTDGSDGAEDCDILYSYAQAGDDFTPPEDMNIHTDGGGGRLRPRIAATGHTFHLLYVDKQSPGISLASFALGTGGAAGADGGSADSGIMDGGPDGGTPDGSIADAGLGGSAGSGGSSGADGGSPSMDAGATGAGAGAVDRDNDDGGCGCRLAVRREWGSGALLPFVLGLLGWRRRRLVDST